MHGALASRVPLYSMKKKAVGTVLTASFVTSASQESGRDAKRNAKSKSERLATISVEFAKAIAAFSNGTRP